MLKGLVQRQSRSGETAPLLRFDEDEFSDGFSRRAVAVEHTLVDNPLLRLEAIAELADSLPPERIERHLAEQPMVLPGGAPDVGGRPSETVLGIEHNGCWMVLWYVEQAAPYKALLDACLQGVLPYAERDGGLQRQEAFIFLSAPNAVTPVHFDPEHNFLLQIKGTKDMNVCPFPDARTGQAELDRYYDGGHRNLEAVPSEGTTFRLHPGHGVYVPTFVPHWVQNGNEASVSLSITFRTPSSERAERVNALNARLRRAGLRPKPPGTSERTDRAKEAAYVATFGLRSRIGRLRRALKARLESRAGP
jgi:hypothetical protein